jgi:hypothetical protein
VAIGLFQVRALDPDFGTAEWGICDRVRVLGPGMFLERRSLVIESRSTSSASSSGSARGWCRTRAARARSRNSARWREGVLRKSFLRYGEFHDQALWGCWPRVV